MTQTTETTELIAQLRERMNDWAISFEAKDVEAMMAFYAPDRQFSAFDLMPPIEFRGGDGWHDNWIHFFGTFDEGPFLEFADEEYFAAGDLGFVRLFSRLTGRMAGMSVDMWARQTNCFQLIDGVWLMVHDHVSFPTDFATGQSLMGLVPPGRA